MRYAIHVMPRLPTDSLFDCPFPDDPRVAPWCKFLTKIGAWDWGQPKMSVRITESNIMIRYEWKENNP